MDFLSYIVDKALVLIPVLLILGQLIKNIEVIPNKWIPLMLLPFGIAGALALGGLNVDSVIQGVLVTGAAVYGNQVWKQSTKTEDKN